jgi:hypothetical protein
LRLIEPFRRNGEMMAEMPKEPPRCEQNPTKTLVEAAVEFARDQRKDYLEAWSARQAR